MSRKCQTAASGDGFAVRTLSLGFRDRHVIAPHAHPWAQLVYASSGVIRVTAPHSAWLVPPTRAIWIPAGESHAIETRGTTSLRTLYVAPDWSAELPRLARAIEIAPLLRELVLHICRLGMLDPAVSPQARLAALLVDLLRDAETSPLSLPMPRDRRARRLADMLLDAPDDRRPIAELASAAGASLRTVQRLFPAETGLSPDAWRNRARLQHAVELLSNGASVTETALATGYSGPSAFILAFRRSFGQTPARYRQSHRKAG